MNVPKSENHRSGLILNSIHDADILQLFVFLKNKLLFMTRAEATWRL